MSVKVGFLSVLVLCLFISAPFAKGQTKADSLRKEIRGLQGTTKAKALLELAKLYTKSNLDSSKRIFEEALQANLHGNDTVTIHLLCKFAKAVSDVGEQELARHYLVMAREMKSPEAQSAVARAKVYQRLFELHYWHFTNYDSCLYYSQLWIDIAPDSTNRAWAYIEHGVSYNEQGNNTRALENYNIARALLQSPKADPWMLHHVTNNLGLLYADERELKKAEEYFLKALDHAKASKVPGADLPELNNLGVLYEWLGEYDKSLHYLSLAAERLPFNKDPWSEANNVLNVGTALAHGGKPAQGLKKYEQSLALFTKLKDEYKIAALHRLMAEAYRLLGNYREAEREAMLALQWDKKNGTGDLTKESYQELYRIYNATRQFEKAFDFQSRYLKIVDSLNSEQRRTKFGLMEKNFEIEQQEREREKLLRENELQRVQAEASRTTQIILIAGSLALAIAAAAAVLAYRRSKAKNVLLNEQKKKIEEQAQQLEEAARTKARFFANVSHELRTPVTLLNGMLELMQENPAGNGTAEKMEIALGSSRRLQGMLNEVLDLSRVEGGKWELLKKRKEILPLLNRIVLAFESLMIKKKLRLEYAANALAGLSMDVDEDKLEKIVNNLIYNAIKFNHENGWIRITGQRSESTIVIQVADSGIGIPENELPHIFDRFYQSSSTEKLNSQGIGIGLSLVKEFTQLQGGHVTVTSRVNEGSCFTIELPITAALPMDIDVAEPLVEPEVSFATFANKPVVLVVEDNEEMRFYLREILGHDVAITEARHGREGLTWLKTIKPDLIISDVMMPEMDGYEFLAQLKSNATYRSIPVVMLTARAAEEDLLQGLRLGVDDYIIKPFNAKELKIRIHNLLTNQEIRREWSQKPVEADEAAPAIVGEDNGLLEKIRVYVETNADNAALGIGDLGDHLAMSERQVYRKTATLTGMTPAQLIKEIRLKIAYRLLLDKQVNKVSDLARRVGFENSSYFSRQFLERFGKRPVDFL